MLKYYLFIPRRVETIEYFKEENDILRWENWSKEDKEILVNGKLGAYLHNKIKCQYALYIDTFLI